MYPSDEKARQERIPRRIKELFESSPLVSPEPGSRKTQVSKKHPTNQLGHITRKKDGGAFTKGDSTTNLKGWWLWQADCPTAGIIKGQWLITEHDPMGPFKGKFKEIKKFIGDFEGIADDTGSDYGGIFFDRKKPGPEQKWTGEFSNLDWTLIKGHLKSSILPDCSFMAKKCLDSKCSSFFTNR